MEAHHFEGLSQAFEAFFDKSGVKSFQEYGGFNAARRYRDKIPPVC